MTNDKDIIERLDAELVELTKGGKRLVALGKYYEPSDQEQAEWLPTTATYVERLEDLNLYGHRCAIALSQIKKERDSLRQQVKDKDAEIAELSRPYEEWDKWSKAIAKKLENTKEPL